MKSTVLENQQRRQFMAGFAAMFCTTVTGTLFGADAVARALDFDSAEPTTTRLFNPPQFALLARVVDLVIPQTDTPGALAVNCHRFIDDQLFHCHPPEMQQSMIDLVDFIELSAQKFAKSTFLQLSQQQQIQLLTDMELAQNGFNQSHRLQFKQLKTLICFGYYTSQVGASQELAYQAIPGGYKGSVPYKQVGRGWGSLAYY